MNLFKLFKNEEKGKSMMKPIAQNADKHDSVLIWNRFWGQYDGVLEMGCLRQSINLKPENAEQVEKMFIDSIKDLIETSLKLIDDYEKTKRVEEK